MLYRSLHDLTPPTEADLDTPEMVETAAAVERGERHLRILARLTEISMALAEGLGELAQARIEAAKTEDRAPTPVDAATLAAYNKMTQTVRRTVALEAKLASEVSTRRDGLIAERVSRRAAQTEAHAAAKSEAIVYGLHDAFEGSASNAEYEEFIDRLMEDSEECLRDADEFRGWLDRPVGETVARLCAAMGLDPDACTPDGDTWTVRRAPTEFERLLADRAQKSGMANDHPSPNGEGQDAKHPGWGSVMKPIPEPCRGGETSPP